MDDSTQNTEQDHFSELKEAFGRLQLDEKVEFLVTESVSTVAEAALTLIEAVSRECSQLFGTEAEKDTSRESSQSDKAS